MVNANLYADTVEKKKDDAKELVAILNKIPEEKKGEVIGIVKGYALCAENQRVRLWDGTSKWSNRGKSDQCD